MVRMKCPKKHILKIDEKELSRKQAIGGKVKCKSCKHLYSVSELKPDNKVETVQHSEEKKAEPGSVPEVQEKSDTDFLNDMAKKADEHMEEVNKELFKDSSFDVGVEESSAELPVSKVVSVVVAEEKPKKKEKPEKAEISEKNVSDFLEVIFNKIAARRGDFWKLSAEDKEQIVPLTTKVINKYTAPGLGKYSDEIVLGIAVIITVGGRWMHDAEVNKGKKPKSEVVKIDEKKEEVVPVVVSAPDVSTVYPGIGGGF